MSRAVDGRSKGYTILETMIFLAVSAAMFISAMALINGKQQRTEFTAAVRDFESSLSDIANDVSNGYYTNVTTAAQPFYCHATGTNILVNTTSSPIQGCVLIGRAVQFAPSGSLKGAYSTINLVGRQYKNGDPAFGDVTSFAESGVVAVAPATSVPYNTVPDARSDTKLTGGVTIECVLYSPLTPPAAPPSPSPCGGSLRKIDTVTFMTTFHDVNVSGQQQTGSSQVDIVLPTASTAVGRSKTAVAQSLDNYSTGGTISNPPGGVYVCLQSNGSNQYALVTIGGPSSRGSTSTQIYTGGGCN